MKENSCIGSRLMNSSKIFLSIGLSLILMPGCKTKKKIYYNTCNENIARNKFEGIDIKEILSAKFNNSGSHDSLFACNLFTVVDLNTSDTLNIIDLNPLLKKSELTNGAGNYKNGIVFMVNNSDSCIAFYSYFNMRDIFNSKYPIYAGEVRLSTL